MKILSGKETQKTTLDLPQNPSAFSLTGLASLFGAMRDAIVVTDAEGVTLYLNPAAETLTGWACGQKVAPDHQKIEIMRNGQKVPLSILASALPGPDGPAQYHIMTLHDLTEQALSQEILHSTIAELEKSVEELTRSNAALKKFSHIAAHDLKSPIGAIVQLADILNSKYAASLDPKGAELLRCIGDSAGRMRVLVDDLLNYSSLNSGPVAPADCTVALEQALENLKDLIREKEAIVSYSSLPELTAAPPHLMQVFQNLIRNAIQYAGVPQPAIHISATSGEDSWLFSVRDNGQGIAERYYTTIFEPFQRLHGHSHAGSGIGLALCRKIIEDAGGKIWVESQPGIHTTFFFTLP